MNCIHGFQWLQTAQSTNRMWSKVWFSICSFLGIVDENLKEIQTKTQFKNEINMKLKVFQQIQRILAVMGFAPNQQQNGRNLNYRQMIFVIVCVLNVTFLTSYIFLEATDIEEYMDAIFSLIVMVTIAVAFTSIIFKNDQLFNYIECLAKELTDRKCSHLELNTISESKMNSWFFLGSEKNALSRRIHKRTNHSIEKLCKIVSFATIELGVPGLMLPKATICYIIYYTTDAGSDAFDLPFQTR